MQRAEHSLSIGLFAHNEEGNICRTLESLADQDVFSATNLNVRLTILANGCSDNTVAVAQEYLRNSNEISGHVMDIAKPGKSNAWNRFIHDDTNALVDSFVCMDSDITFGSKDVISQLLAALRQSDQAYLSIDVAKKDTLLKNNKTIFESISLFFSKLMNKGSTAVAGSLYCARGDQLRKITMPEGLPVEDGFLRAMLVTELFTWQDNNQRILVVDQVCHYFTPDPSIKSLFRHEERLLIGTFINSVIYGYLWAEVAETGTDAGQLVARNNIQNPLWVEELISQYRETHSPLIPRHFYFKYWKRWKGLDFWPKVISFPVIALASCVKYFLLKKVERRLATESGLGTW